MDDSKRAAALLMSQCMSTFAQELNIRAKMIFGPGGNGEGGSANPADLANDRAAFSSAGMKGAGVGIVSTVSSVVISKRWHLLARLPFVSVVGFAGFGFGNLFFTKEVGVQWVLPTLWCGRLRQIVLTYPSVRRASRQRLSATSSKTWTNLQAVRRSFAPPCTAFNHAWTTSRASK